MLCELNYAGQTRHMFIYESVAMSKQKGGVLMAIEREYWKQANADREISEYPDVTSVTFPELIVIAYAVCIPECGYTDFIADGGPQICPYCGKSMFTTFLQGYRKLPEGDTTEIPPWSHVG